MKPTKRRRATKLDTLYRLAVKNGGYFVGAGCKTKFCIKLTDLKKIVDHLKPKLNKKSKI